MSENSCRSCDSVLLQLKEQSDAHTSRQLYGGGWMEAVRGSSVRRPCQEQLQPGACFWNKEKKKHCCFLTLRDERKGLLWNFLRNLYRTAPLPGLCILPPWYIVSA
ncbi:unnamed protein product [Pleuronectes platessa]|uniref:Uncharacterized protein n=1 Tax=Pleuronectes platessa TaxID=8262 RepID=A0A9N7YKH9_PLEPL|nr:unnamed protein product [Pleuronectes platessa]